MSQLAGSMEGTQGPHGHLSRGSDSERTEAHVLKSLLALLSRMKPTSHLLRVPGSFLPRPASTPGPGQTVCLPGCPGQGPVVLSWLFHGWAPGVR